MTGPVSVASWSEVPASRPEPSSFQRLWRAFATARAALGVAVLALLGGLPLLERATAVNTVGPGVLAACVAYVALALALRLWGGPPTRSADPRWIATPALDLLAVAGLQLVQAGGINFAPLYAVPVLMAAVLGRAPLAMGTAAAATVLMLADAAFADRTGDTASRLLQAGLTGAGYLALAVLAHQMAVRLARAERRARQSQEAERLQAEVNSLVIATLADGILVIDADGRVRAANPTACMLLGVGHQAPGFSMADHPGWHVLLEMAQQTIALAANQRRDLTLEGPPPQRLSVRTRLAATGLEGGLCVMFLEDLREMEARLRTEKLASMGRMSAAVAHEIRNPLSAIAQANALLDEELTDPQQRQLSALVGQNARRLSRIVEDILDVARVRQSAADVSPALALDSEVATACADWARQVRGEQRMQLALSAPQVPVAFDADQLRRVLVNLLDNALRHASQRPDAIQVATHVEGGQARLVVWSDGAPLEAAVQRHLFEPFFSSESRSSGLGLYICRELCLRHGAQIDYLRSAAPMGGDAREGNAFTVRFAPAPATATIGK